MSFLAIHLDTLGAASKISSLARNACIEIIAGEMSTYQNPSGRSQ